MDDDATAQHIKDFKLAIEFKHLMKNAPVGVYLLPEFDCIRALHGVIFIHGGLYKDGIFRFRIDLPPAYNDINTHPIVTFTPPIFNPLVDPATGILNLACDEALKEWQPERHFLVTVTTFIKKIFYCKSFDTFTNIPNVEAKNLFNHDKEEFLNRVALSVQESKNRIYDTQSGNCSLIFTEPKPGHNEVIRSILHRKLDQEERDGAAGAAAGSHRSNILDDEMSSHGTNAIDKYLEDPDFSQSNISS